MAPKQTNESSASAAKPQAKQLKGLPVVAVPRDEPCWEYKLNIHGLFEIKYVYVMWFFVSLGLAGFIYAFRIAIQHENFGYNSHFCLMVFMYGYIMDLFSKMAKDFAGVGKGRLLRISVMSHVVIQFFFTITIPFCFHDLKLHLLLCFSRDMIIACSADIIRVYLWPDNLQNRKRIANFQSIMDEQGWWFWMLVLKTPITRVMCEHQMMKYFVHEDTLPFEMTRFLFFPLQILAFELVTDFFYYWMHRGLHEWPFIYKAVHKLHHSSKCPTGLNASSMTVAESLITFFITDCLTPFLFFYIWPMNVTESGLYTCWLTLIEVYGHAGLCLAVGEISIYRMGLSGFLVGFGILLDSKDHELHHWNNTCNYAKRTQFWDKAFGTYDYSNIQMCADACLGSSLENLDEKKLDKKKA